MVWWYKDSGFVLFIAFILGGSLLWEVCAVEKKGTVKTMNVQTHDFETNDGLVVKKEKKHTTTIKHKDAGPTSSKGQRKQMKELCE